MGVHVSEVGARTQKGEILHENQRFVYWYVAPGIHTTSRLQRTWMMAKDNIVSGKSRRWAYVAVMTRRGSGGELLGSELETFLEELVPAILPDATESDQ